MKGNKYIGMAATCCLRSSFTFFCCLGIFLFNSCSVTNIPVQLEPTSHIIESGQARDDLFVNANIWLVESFNSAKDVIQFSDKEAGIVMGKYLLQTPTFSSSGTNPNPEGIYALIKLQVKDGTTRITIVPESFFELQKSIYLGETFSRQDVQNQINALIQSYTGFVRYDKSNEW